MADIEEAARRLLRVLSEHQAHGREGAAVKLGEEEAMGAGLRPGSHLYRAAVWWLLDNDALVPYREANERLRNTVGAQHHDFAFRLTQRGLDMLREA